MIYALIIACIQLRNFCLYNLPEAIWIMETNAKPPATVDENKLMTYENEMEE